MIPTPERHMDMEAFWQWLQGHPNCVIRAGSPDATLFDHDDFHWVFFDEEDRQGIIQVLKGKDLVGELVIPRRHIREVRLGPDLESPEGHFLAELLGEGEEEPEALFHLVLSHGFEEPPPHGTLRH